MKYRRLGDTGLKVSVVGLGSNQFGGKVSSEEVREILAVAADCGINFVDTADIYQGGASETAIGEALKGRRDDFVVATKVGLEAGNGPNDRGASRRHILDSVRRSLRRLGTDYIDLYQMHTWDDETPPEETLRTLDDLVSSGTVRYIGVSNWNAWQLCLGAGLAESRGWSRIASVQPHYNLLAWQVEEELIPCCRHFGVGVIPYFPLAGGFLTGKYRRGEAAPEGSRGESSEYVQRFLAEPYYDVMEQLEEYAGVCGFSPGQLAIAWLLAQPQVASVIAGVTSIDHLEENAGAANWGMTYEEERKIRGIVERAGRT
ncbi:MAG: aldo/keto reductase [Bacillota bacterium]